MKKIEKITYEVWSNGAAYEKFNEIISTVNEMLEEQWSRYCPCENPQCKSPHWPKREPKYECVHVYSYQTVKHGTTGLLIGQESKFCPLCGEKL